MSQTIFQISFDAYRFYRNKTLDLLTKIESEPNPQEILGWRAGPGRAHIGWQLMHIGITEELFATERLAPGKAAKYGDLWPRYRVGSTPDDNIPSASTIREVLENTRASLLETLSGFNESHLEVIPEALKARGLTIRDVLYLLSWHEAHHQGQAHFTLNSYKAGLRK